MALLTLDIDLALVALVRLRIDWNPAAVGLLETYRLFEVFTVCYI